jgi:polar amino acid transport system permease protein
MGQKPQKLTLLDGLLAMLIAAFLIYLAYRLKVGLHYRWNWGAIPQYLMRFDPQTGRWTPNLLLQGFFTTIRLSVWATLLATLLGFIAGFYRISQSLFKRLLGRTFVELIRNTPPLVLIFIFYYFVSDQIMPVLGVDDWVRNAPPGIRSFLSFFFAVPQYFSTFLSAVLTVAFFEAAYIAEIVRAGIESIEKGQFEAASALGLTWWQKMRHIILPQALVRILPPLAGQFISTIKDSAIVSVISIPELTFQGMELMAATYLTFECWITITVMYLMLTLSLSLAVERLEIYLRRSVR